LKTSSKNRVQPESHIERKNSNHDVWYERLKTVQEEVSRLKFTLIINVTTLLTALTAFKIERYDLIGTPGAFRRLNI